MFIRTLVIRISVITLMLAFACGQVETLSFASTQTRRSQQRKAAHYVCPMHAEITSTRQRSCPKCGMKLRLVKDPSAANSTPAPASAPPAGRNTSSFSSSRIPDAPVYDQNGNRVSFYSDLIKGNTVAINFVFTTCTTICPPLTATFRRVQQELTESAPNVKLISISVDPTVDTPERLREFAVKFKAGPGWVFVTGDKTEIDSILQALGVAVANKNDHTPMILIGNDLTDSWTRTYGLSSPTALEKVILATAKQH